MQGKFGAKEVMVIISKYRKDPRFSQSDVKKWIDLTPERFFYQKKNKKNPTEAMVFGAALHNFILEPETFEEFYFIDTWEDRRAGKAYKDHQKIVCEEAGERTVIKKAGDKSYYRMIEILEWIKGSSLCKTLNNQDNLFEHSLFGEINGVQVKGQLDVYRKGVGIIDLKFTEKAIDKDYQLNKICVDGRYDIQAYMYIELVKQNYNINVPFHFKVISWKEKPILMRTVEISWAKTPELLQNAKDYVDNALFEMDQYKDVTEWEQDNSIYVPSFPDYLYGEN